MSNLTVIFLAFLLYTAYALPAGMFPSPHESYEAQIDSIVNEMSACMNEKLAPILDKLDGNDEAYLKEIGLEGLRSYVEYLFSMKDE